MTVDKNLFGLLGVGAVIGLAVQLDLFSIGQKPKISVTLLGGTETYKAWGLYADFGDRSEWLGALNLVQGKYVVRFDYGRRNATRRQFTSFASAVDFAETLMNEAI
jgi:hypothetical protein